MILVCSLLWRASAYFRCQSVLSKFLYFPLLAFFMILRQVTVPSVEKWRRSIFKKISSENFIFAHFEAISLFDCSQYTIRNDFLEKFSSYRLQTLQKCLLDHYLQLCIYSMPISWFDCRQYAKNFDLLKIFLSISRKISP